MHPPFRKHHSLRITMSYRTSAANNFPTNSIAQESNSQNPGAPEKHPWFHFPDNPGTIHHRQHRAESSTTQRHVELRISADTSHPVADRPPSNFAANVIGLAVYASMRSALSPAFSARTRGENASKPRPNGRLASPLTSYLLE